MVLATLRVEKDRPPVAPATRSGRSNSNEDRESLLETVAKHDPSDDYSRQTVFDITRGRCGWLITFCLGLLLSALIVQRFEDLLEHHVQLSFFVPLVMGHGGNTGSQTVSTLIRALALRQVGQRDLARTVFKEAVAGCLMGALLGIAIFVFSLLWPDLGLGVGATVCVALPIISMWANGVGAALTLLADRFKFDPAVTSVPLMTTIVDASGLIIYFYIAEVFMDVSSNAAAAHAAAAAVAKLTTSGKVVATAAAAAAAAATGAHAAASSSAHTASGKAEQAGKAAASSLKKLMSPPPPSSKGKPGQGKRR